jgi:zinc-ribbon domain
MPACPECGQENPDVARFCLSGGTVEPVWIEAATAFASGDFLRAAASYKETGSLPDEAYARLRAAEALIQHGRRRPEGDRELQRALAFYRSVDATAHLREGEALLAQTA